MTLDPESTIATMWAPRFVLRRWSASGPQSLNLFRAAPISSHDGPASIVPTFETSFSANCPWTRLLEPSRSTAALRGLLSHLPEGLAVALAGPLV